MRVLISFHGSFGHFHPFVPLVRALGEAGHEVAFACPDSYREILAANGFQAFFMGYEWRNPEGRQWIQHELERIYGTSADQLPNESRATWAHEHLFAGRMVETMLPSLLKLYESWPYDLVVRDTTGFAGYLAAEKLGLPHATAGASAVFRASLYIDAVRRPINRHRAELGLAPDPRLHTLWRYLDLVPAPASYLSEDDCISPVTHFIRPAVFDQSGDETLPAWVDALNDRPIVYASLGTSVGQTPAVYRAIIEAMADEPVNLILTLGRNLDPVDYDPGAQSVYVERYIPQSLLFPHCNLVITHGGFNTLMSALGQALPLVVIPIAADQFDNAVRTSALGVARVIDRESRTPEAIREAAMQVLNDPTYRQNARRFQTEIAALPGLDYAVALLERLATERRPVARIIDERPDRLASTCQSGCPG